jgi:hypothetical protein
MMKILRQGGFLKVARQGGYRVMLLLRRAL